MSAINVAEKAVLSANELNASSANVGNTLVLRDGNGSISVNILTGSATHALEADKWTSPITLRFNGSVSGSAQIDGTTDVTIEASVPGNPAILYLDDSTMSTTATGSATIKSLRYYNNGNITSINAVVSVWNATSSSTTTVGMNVDGSSSTTTTVSGTNEQFVLLKVPTPTSMGTHTLNLTLSTSNASYAAYTKFLQIEVK